MKNNEFFMLRWWRVSVVRPTIMWRRWRWWRRRWWRCRWMLRTRWSCRIQMMSMMCMMRMTIRACTSTRLRCLQRDTSLGLTSHHQSMEVELVRVSFPVHFRHDIFVVVVSAKQIHLKYNTVIK